MSFQLPNSKNIPRVELRSKECIDTVLKPLTDNIKIKINGSLTCKDIFHTTVCMAVDKGSVHSISKHYQKVVCETSIRHHFQKLDLDNLIRINEKILLQEALKILEKG
ncbi:ISH3 family transposase, partial [Methanococcoides seepicolus]|nr:ISH3 family transposase [Methanococcoides seepicolus]